MEEEHPRNRRAKFPLPEYCAKAPVSFVYTRQARVRIFHPSAVSVQTVFRTVYLAQVLNAVVGSNTVYVVDLFWKATAYQKEHQPVLQQLKLLSPKENNDSDIAVPMYHSWILTVPLPVDQLSRRCIISVGRKQILLKRFPLFLC